MMHDTILHNENSSRFHEEIKENFTRLDAAKTKPSTVHFTHVTAKSMSFWDILTWGIGIGIVVTAALIGCAIVRQFRWMILDNASTTTTPPVYSFARLPQEARETEKRSFGPATV